MSKEETSSRVTEPASRGEAETLPDGDASAENQEVTVERPLSPGSVETTEVAGREVAGHQEIADTEGSGGSGGSEAGAKQVPSAPARVVQHTVRRLPNCKITGIEYHASLADAMAGLSHDEIIDVAVQQESGFELLWNAEKFEISCCPDRAGEFEIDLQVDLVRHERHIFPFKLTVNPDPKTLWKNIPSDPNGVYAKPDSDKKFLACGEKLSIVAASQRGRSHAQDGKPRDDDFCADYSSETDCAILVVADGAGYAKFAREGSRVATQVALEKVKSAVTAEFWTNMNPAIKKWASSRDVQAEKSIQSALYKVLVHAAWEAKMQIKKEAQNHEARYLADYKKAEKFTARDYGTTLILTVAKRLEGGGWFVATFWVGDGGVGIYRGTAGEVRVQGTPDGGEYGGQTRFLTEDSTEVWPQDANRLIERRLRFDVVDSFDAVVLMTDGVTDPKFETENNLVSVAKWNELWADLGREVPFGRRDGSVAEALLKWMDFWSPGNHDDRTMMILY